MTRCDREFLIPYLKDVCTLELMKKKLNAEKFKTLSQIDQIENYRIPEEPQVPTRDSWLLDSFLSVIGLVVFFPLLFTRGGWGMLFIIVPCAMSLFFSYSSSSDKYDREMKEYEREKANRKAALQKRDQERKKLPGLRNTLSIQNQELQTIANQLQNVYSVNIIPGQYRNIYAAVYFYDWFSKGRSDDLDMAINTFVLEQIKDRLDRIIQQLSEVLINQSISIANQEKSLAQQDQYQARMENRLKQIQASHDEQLMYLDMIESHTRVSAFFAAENYFNRNR